MKLVYQCIAIFFNFYTTSSHLHPLQVENCGSNSWLVVDEDDYGKFRPERVNGLIKVCPQSVYMHIHDSITTKAFMPMS